MARLSIDPRGVLGDAEFMLPPLLWNRFDGERDLARRFDHFVGVAGLCRDRALGWALVRARDYFLWSAGAGPTWDPAACDMIINWTLSR